MGAIDLEDPAIPDAAHDLAPDFDWPEAGSSKAAVTRASSDSDSDSSRSPPPSSAASVIGPFGAKAAAAMTGAMATSLLMTPFDVLKTRLQTVQPHLRPEFLPPPIECCQTPLLNSAATAAASSNVICGTSTLPGASPPRAAPAPASAMTVPAPHGCYHPSKWAGIWGEAMSFEEGLSRGLLGPKGSLRAALATTNTGFWGEIVAVKREAGLRGLWKGVGTTLTMSIPSSAIYMLGYEYLLSQLTPVFTSAPSATLTPAPLVAGSLARTLSATIISPIEMFRTRLQALPQPDRPPPTYGSTGREMVQLVRDKGVTVLWRGLGPTLWRDVPFSGLYWAGFEVIKSYLNSPDTSITLSPLATSFVSGALSGTISALFTQPFDVLKTRRQVFTPSKDCAPEALRHRASTLPLAAHVVRSEGWRALFAGVVPRCAKVAPACGLMIACYEGVGRYLGSERK